MQAHETGAKAATMAVAKRAVLYFRASTGEQTVESQRRDLEAAAAQRGWIITATYADEGISGAKDRNKRPGLDAMLKDAALGNFDVVMCWAVDRIGRSLPDLVGTLQKLHGAKVDLFLHQQAIDTTTPAGHAMFGMMGVFAEFERSMAQTRIKAGLARARASPRMGAKAIGRPKVVDAVETEIRSHLMAGIGVLKVARTVGVGTSAVQRIKAGLRPRWTPYSLWPPTPDDGPFYLKDFEMVVAADVVALPLPKTTPHFDNVAQRYPALSLQAELPRLCRAYNHEVLSALAGALQHSAAGAVRRGRQKSLTSAHPASCSDSQVRVPAKPTKSFDASVIKNPTLPMRDELRQLCRNLPSEALSALSHALRKTVAGHVKRGNRRLQGLEGPPAHIRIAVELRRRRGVSDNQIAREIEHLLPREEGEASRRKRARREVAAIPRSASPGPRLAFAMAHDLWALNRAARQLGAAVRRGLMSEEEAVQRLDTRKSRFMSRAQGKHLR